MSHSSISKKKYKDDTRTLFDLDVNKIVTINRDDTKQNTPIE